LAVAHVDRGKATRPVELGVAFDPCADDFYRSLMASYTDMDQSAELLDDYSLCREILTRDLGIAPADADKIFRGNLD
jgi:DNA-binding SARP family transcriptional activator